MSRVIEGPALYLVPVNQARSPMSEAAGAPFAVGLFSVAGGMGDGISFTLDEVVLMIERAVNAGTISVGEAAAFKSCIPALKERGFFDTIEELFAAITAKATDGTDDEFHLKVFTDSPPFDCGYVFNGDGDRVSGPFFTQADLAFNVDGWITQGDMSLQTGINLLAAAAGLPVREPKVVPVPMGSSFYRLLEYLIGARFDSAGVVTVHDIVARLRPSQQAPAADVAVDAETHCSHGLHVHGEGHDAHGGGSSG